MAEIWMGNGKLGKHSAELWCDPAETLTAPEATNPKYPVLLHLQEPVQQLCRSVGRVQYQQ